MRGRDRRPRPLLSQLHKNVYIAFICMCIYIYSPLVDFNPNDVWASWALNSISVKPY